jgi:hypothetical protein
MAPADRIIESKTHRKESDVPNENTLSIEPPGCGVEPHTFHELPVYQDTARAHNDALGMSGPSSNGRKVLHRRCAAEFAGMGGLGQTGRLRVPEKDFQGIVRESEKGSSFKNQDWNDIMFPH